MSTPRAARARARRDEILDAAQRIFVDKGYHAAGIADIAAALGMGHGTFYRYFGNKHDIAVQVLDRAVAAVAAVGLRADPNASETLAEYEAQSRAILRDMLAMCDTHPELMRFLHEQSVVVDLRRLDGLVDATVARMAAFLRNGLDKGFLRADLDVDVTAQLLVALIFDGMRRALAEPDAAHRSRWVEAGVRLMFNGLKG